MVWQGRVCEGSTRRSAVTASEFPQLHSPVIVARYHPRAQARAKKRVRMETSTRTRFLQPAVRFEEMTCDFVRDPERRWWLLQVKSFKLQKAVQTLT